MTNPKQKYDLFINRATLFKLALLVGVVAISAGFVWYISSIIHTLQQDARSQVGKYVQLWQLAANSPTSGGELEFIFNEIIVEASFPIIVLNDAQQPIHWRNIPDLPPDDTTAAAVAEITQIAAQMYGADGEYPIYFGETAVNYLCYGDSDLINQLKIMPFVTIGIVISIMIIGLIGFQNIRRSEEQHIWVGMAKETAHQLGTPISSLLGWLDLLDSDCVEGAGAATQGSVSVRDAIDNMQVDVQRLHRVANRFSQIGSIPELVESDLNQLVLEVVEYYRRRLPFEGKGITIDYQPGNLPKIAANSELFTWTLENLIKNALQVVDSKTGRISLRTSTLENGSQVLISIEDNGPGIPSAAIRKIFRAGFTTKTRGWGLGLTLVKRIIEEYHGGRVWVEKSSPGLTQFMISLPVYTIEKG